MIITCIKLILPSLYNLITSFYIRFLLFLLGVYTLPYKYKKHSNQKNPNIIISSQSSIIDWLILFYNYTPKFLYFAKSKDNKTDSLVELSLFNLLSYGNGLKFPKASKKNCEIKKYIEQNKNGSPIVIFPEATKSNRLAVLSIRSNIMDDIYKMAQEKKICIRGEIIVNKNYQFNTTDTCGFKTLFKLCCNFYTQIEIYSQDIKNDNFIEDNNNEYDMDKYPNFNLYLDYIIQEYLMEPTHRNIVSLNSFDHEKFIEYFNKTNKDSKANYVKKNE